MYKMNLTSACTDNGCNAESGKARARENASNDCVSLTLRCNTYNCAATGIFGSADKSELNCIESVQFVLQDTRSGPSENIDRWATLEHGDMDGEETQAEGARNSGAPERLHERVHLGAGSVTVLDANPKATRMLSFSRATGDLELSKPSLRLHSVLFREVWGHRDGGLRMSTDAKDATSTESVQPRRSIVRVGAQCLGHLHSSLNLKCVTPAGSTAL